MPEELKLAVLTRCISGQLKTYVNVRWDEDAKYDVMRDAILRFHRSNTKWTSAAIFGHESKDEVVAMEVDRIKGKGKGKEKILMEKENKMVKAKAMVHMVLGR